MSLLLYCLFVALSFLQLTIQSSTNNPISPDRIELILVVHRNESGQYVVETSPRSLPENNTLIVRTDMSEPGDPIILKFEGTYAVTDYLRNKSTLGAMTDVPESASQTTTNSQEINKVPTKAVPKDYKYFPGLGYYKFYPEGGKSYNEAMKTCSDDGAHLAIINSEAEKKVLMDIFLSHSKQFYYTYLGFQDQCIDGKRVPTLVDSAALRQTGHGKPIQYHGNEKCGALSRSGRIYPLKCTGYTNVAFLCEYDLLMGTN